MLTEFRAVDTRTNTWADRLQVTLMVTDGIWRISHPDHVKLLPKSIYEDINGTPIFAGDRIRCLFGEGTVIEAHGSFFVTFPEAVMVNGHPKHTITLPISQTEAIGNIVDSPTTPEPREGPGEWPDLGWRPVDDEVKSNGS